MSCLGYAYAQMSLTFQHKQRRNSMAKLQRIVKILICAGLLSAFLGCSTTQKQETAGQYVDDSVITTKVKSAIVEDMSLKGFQINVKTYQGVVQLSGFVDSADHAKKAGELARGVQGVTEVKNDLIVK
jgi:predicted membrane metal-binding protein